MSKARNIADIGSHDVIETDSDGVTITGDLTIPDKIVHTGDTNTAIRFPAADTVTVETAGSERLRVDSDGNVGIGTSSPVSKFDLASGNITISNSTNAPYINFVENTTRSQSLARITMDQVSGTAGQLLFSTTTGGTLSESARIDASGNLLVGTTTNDASTTSSTSGVNVRAVGQIATATDGTVGAIFNRLTSDGDIALFRKDGTTVGVIGSANKSSVSRLVIGTGDTGLYFFDGIDAIYPVNANNGTDRDNAVDLGASSVRFDDIYATNGTIQTSDRNEKQDIEALSDAEQRVAVAAKGLLRKYRWKDAVAEKGDKARIHFGIIAQDLQAAFEAEGLDAGRYGMFISSTWTDEETGEERSRMGVRYSELLAFIIAAI